MELYLEYDSSDGPTEIPVEGDRFSFGRGSDADLRFEDSGLSRLHATLYRDGEKVWIVDENSSNGTFVNGDPTAPSGTPLSDGDEVKIGHNTKLRVIFRAPASAEAQDEPAADGTVIVPKQDAEQERSSLLLPLAILAVALFVIGASAIVIGVTVMGNGEEQVATTDTGETDIFGDGFDDPGTETGNDDGGDLNTGGNSSSIPSGNGTTGPGGNTLLTDPLQSRDGGTQNELPKGKTYQQMTEAEKNQYVKVKAEVVSRVIGNSSGESIPPEAVAKIRYWLDGYVRRIRSTRKNDCSGGGWLSSDMVSILERAKSNSPFIIRAFNERGIDPQVGLYLAMIESEHCPCLQSYTGPLGMFQFTQATGRRHGLDTRPGASPSNPDERCEKEPAARAAASYMKSLTGRIGTGPLSIPLAIASYNSGEGGLGKNLRTALEANESQERSFWTLVANAEKLAEQFQRENIKYVPKFFAAAIIGENPKDFGIDMLPLSLYTK